ncbi:MAG: discoidin domain-containing protein [Lachnospiraceae bacterium]|nr:discoidin domain-containing protein [Lachnospiraceae bacterium]
MGNRTKTLYTVANAHLDTQWNWTIQDTIRDCVKNTLEYNFRLIEKYPNYQFNFEGAFRYKLAKEYSPDLYEKLKLCFREGRWNFAGSSWDACDANVPSSEAFMRQVLYGNGFIEREFGAEEMAKDIFLPDCFGFRWSLPSIAAHMGLIGFSTQKLVWGVGSPIWHEGGRITRPMPDKDSPRMDLCRWIGPDGNEVTGSFLEGGYTYNYDQHPDQPVGRREQYLRDIEHNEKYAGVPLRSMYYGAGDYGGSPTDGAVRMVEEAIADKDALYDVKSSSSYAIFEDLTKEEHDAIPAYTGNILIPHGYGAMVSHTISKRWNRKNERLADAAEKANSIAVWLGGEYPEKRLRTAWENFLWHQFHDDVTGTSMGAAYTFSYNDYVISLNAFAAELTAGIGKVSKRFGTDKVKGEPVLVFNPASASRYDLVTLEWKTDARFARVFDKDGNELPAQSKREGEILKVLFEAPVKPVSVTLFDLRASETPCALKTGLSVSENRLESDRFAVVLDENGDVSSITDKKAGRELLSAPIHFELMPDTHTGPYPAWEYKYEDFSKPFEVLKASPKVGIAENGPAAVSLRVERKSGNTVYVQYITLTANGARVDFDNEIDWAEKQKMLRVAFPTTVKNPEATFDLGLGAEKNGNSVDNFPYYQYLVHEWADLTETDGSFGISILNDCKYSMDKPDDSTLRLTLIHTPAGAFSPNHAQDYLDWGRNIFRFSVASHIGARDGIAAEAEGMNEPAVPFFAAKHPGTLTELSFLSSSNGEHLIRAAKKGEKNGKLIVRVQETSGNAGSATLTFPGKILSAVETNGYEKPISEARFYGNTLYYSVQGYGVRTFAVILEKGGNEAEGEGTPIALDFDTRITTTNAHRGSFPIADGISVPAELWENEIYAGGVRFETGDALDLNALTAKGQKLALPEGTARVSLLAFSRGGDKKATFTAGTPVTLGVQDFRDFVGSWDLPATGAYCEIKRDAIAHVFTHTHEKAGDRLYLYCNVYQYEIPTNGAAELTLPEDPDIVILAATALTDPAILPARPLYDRADAKDIKTHTVTVKGGTGSGTYAEGKVVLLRADDISDDGLFEGFEADAPITQNGLSAYLFCPDRDVTAAVKRKFLGKLLTKDGMSVKASSSNSRGERPEQALRPDRRSKWCALVEPDGSAWMEVDLGEEKELSSWLVSHAGTNENPAWNTVDFRLEYRSDESADWQTADGVTGNTENRTIRSFTPVKGRFVRLFITKATADGNDHCRIFRFCVFGN